MTARATLQPASNGMENEIASITVIDPGGGKILSSGPLPGYDLVSTGVTLVGGLPYDEATFDYLFPDFSEHNQSVLSEVRFHVVGNGGHYPVGSQARWPFPLDGWQLASGVYAYMLNWSIVAEMFILQSRCIVF